MSNLSGFLAQNAVKVENIKHIVSNRFLDEKGKAIPWEIKAITSTEDEEIRKSCVVQIPIPGKKNQFKRETDFDLYVSRLASRCTVFPNLNDVELQNSYGVMGAEALLKRMLTPGEFADYLEKVQQINGFESTMEDLVDEAKN